MGKQIVDSMAKGFLARGHSLAWSRESEFSIAYAAKQFKVVASEPAHFGYALKLIEQAEGTGFIREIVGRWKPVSPQRAVRMSGTMAVPLSETARVYLPPWLKDPKQVETFAHRLYSAGLNTVILGDGRGEGKAEAAAPFLDPLKEWGIQVILRPILTGSDRPPYALWVDSRLDHFSEEFLTKKEMVVKEMGPGIFTPPEELGDFSDLAPKGVCLALTARSADLLRKRATPCYTPLCLSYGDLPLFSGHVVQVVYLSESDWEKDNSLLFRTI